MRIVNDFKVISIRGALPRWTMIERNRIGMPAAEAGVGHIFR